MRRSLLAAVLVAALLLPAAPAEAVSPRPSNFASGGDVVEFAYTHLLGREPDAGGLGVFRPQLEAAGADPVALLDTLAHSAEYDGYVGQLLRMYRTAFARDADAPGATFWLSRRAAAPGLSFAQSGLADFLRSSEFTTIYGGTTDREFVRRIYTNALGRQPDQGGSDFWTGRVAVIGRPAVLLQISESAEHRARRRIDVEITGIHHTLLGRLPDAAGRAQWTSYFQGGGTSRGFLATIWGSPELANRLATVPTLTVQTLVTGLDIPWGLAFAPDGTMVFTQRNGAVRARRPDGTLVTVAAPVPDLFASGEGGLLDIALDPSFATNRRFYVCMDRSNGSRSVPLDVAVIAWTMAADFSSATRDAGAPLVSGLPNSGGRHSGCRILPDPATPGVLYIGTGDAAQGTNAQDLGSLGGKVLRVSSTTGQGVPGNPFIGSSNANTRRIFNFGHRNIQGITVRPGTGQIWTAEHGSDRDDELNLVVPGGNYGWNPVPGYNEAVPMTDLRAYPGAIRASWTSGAPTVATSGMAFLHGCAWGAYADHAAVGLLKGSALRIHGFTRSALDLGFVQPGPLSGSFGRIRTVVQGPDDSLYVTTSNGGGADVILRVTPTGGRCGAGS